MEIKTLIIQQIQKVFENVNVYDEKITQGLQTPAFLVRIIRSGQERKVKGQVQRSYSFNVVYFPKSTKVDPQSKKVDTIVDKECDDALEKFKTEFKYIANKYHVHRLEGTKEGDVLVITFAVTVRLKEKTDETKMRTLGGVEVGTTN